MLYTLIKYGFKPQLALLDSNSTKNRLEKIVGYIKESQYGIHDLSRIKSSEIGEYSRLNMPFELGIDYGYMLAKNNNEKKLLVIGAEKHEYKIALSDFSGFDIKYHFNKPIEIIDCIRSWLLENSIISTMKASIEIFDDYNTFNSTLFSDINLKYKQKNAFKKAIKMAKDEINRMTVAEYISKIKKH